jgi:hypothetical protein
MKLFVLFAADALFLAPPLPFALAFGVGFLCLSCRVESRCQGRPAAIAAHAEARPGDSGTSHITYSMLSGRSAQSTDASARPGASPWSSGRCVRV